MYDTVLFQTPWNSKSGDHLNTFIFLCKLNAYRAFTSIIWDCIRCESNIERLFRFGCRWGVNGVFIMISVSEVIADTFRRQITGRCSQRKADRNANEHARESYRYRATLSIRIPTICANAAPTYLIPFELLFPFSVCSGHCLCMPDMYAFMPEFIVWNA